MFGYSEVGGDGPVRLGGVTAEVPAWDYKSLREFAEREGLKYNGNFRKKTKGWDKEKGAKEEQKRSKIIEAVLEKQIQHEIDRNTRHLIAWDKFLQAIEEAMENYRHHFFSKESGRLNPYALEKAASVLKMAQEGQRKALGLDEKTEKDDGSLKELADAIRESIKALGDGE